MAKTKRAPQPKNSLPPEQLLTCERCGRDRSEHEHANLSDGGPCRRAGSVLVEARAA